MGQLLLSWRETQLLQQNLTQQQDLLERERALAQRELETEKSRTAVAEKEAAMEKERAEFYRQAFAQIVSKPGFGCVLKKIFTLGLAKCS